MSSSEPALPSRRLVLLGGVAVLAGCGFAPVYGPGGPGTVLRDRLAFELPATPEGSLLERRLEDRLGRAAAPAYVLTVAIETEEDTLAISPDGSTTRLTLVGRAAWSLRAPGSEAVVGEGVVESFTGYTTTASTVATASAEQSARDRLMILLADLIVTRLFAAAPFNA
jgi:LPS-assembly lipoprotein